MRNGPAPIEQEPPATPAPPPPMYAGLSSDVDHAFNDLERVSRGNPAIAACAKLAVELTREIVRAIRESRP